MQVSEITHIFALSNLIISRIVVFCNYLSIICCETGYRPLKLIMMKEYFTLRELLQSTTAKRYNIDNTPTFDVVANLQRLSKFILTPTRYKYGKPIIVTSGYRCSELNTLVGGVKNSQHLNGCAADLVCADMQALFNLLRTNEYVDQLLYESNGKTKWIHVSIANNGKLPRHNIINNYKVK